MAKKVASDNMGDTGAGQVKVVNNLDWTKDVSLIDFLRTVGKMARVNVMMARDRYVLVPSFSSSGSLLLQQAGVRVPLATSLSYASSFRYPTPKRAFLLGKAC